MTFKFEVDLNNLENYKNELTNTLRDLDNNINEMKSLILQMRDIWGGDAAEAYINLMIGRLRYARSVYELLVVLRNSVNKQIESIKQVDNVFEVWVYEITHW